MTPEIAARLSTLYAAAFPEGRVWSAQEIADLAAPPFGFVVMDDDTAPRGFALGRAIAGEAELITLATDPTARRQGLGTRLLTDFETSARALGAESAFLEVAEDNHAARALYTRGGWRETGHRPGYYPRPDGPAVAAVLMVKSLA